jgi:Na+/H+ antiporter NhaD/arsenite permease-like protein
MALASNVGGTATLIGDPPNILIGSAAGLGFNDFLVHLAPVATVCLLFTLMASVPVIRKRAYVSSDIRARLMEMDPRRAITDRALLLKSGSVLIGVLAAFTIHELVHVNPATVALSGAAVLLILTKADPERAFKSVEWSTLSFFVGLFIVVSGLAATGLLGRLADLALSLTGRDLFLTSMVVLWFSALASALMGNIPVVTTLIPVVKSIIPILAQHNFVSSHTVEQTLWWALALGVCLGGNGTMLGAAANVVTVSIAAKNGHEITFGRFLAYGVPVTLATLLISSVSVYIRYIL